MYKCTYVRCVRTIHVIASHSTVNKYSEMKSTMVHVFQVSVISAAFSRGGSDVITHISKQDSLTVTSTEMNQYSSNLFEKYFCIDSAFRRDPSIH
jgi:hypothetical protein